MLPALSVLADFDHHYWRMLFFTQLQALKLSSVDFSVNWLRGSVPPGLLVIGSGEVFAGNPFSASTAGASCYAKIVSLYL